MSYSSAEMDDAREIAADETLLAALTECGFTTALTEASAREATIALAQAGWEDIRALKPSTAGQQWRLVAKHPRMHTRGIYPSPHHKAPG